jgi:Kdo2-lipid IVA lauroyltransferase/acyltransferase
MKLTMAKIGFYLLFVPLYIISLLPRKILYYISNFTAFFLRKIIRYRLDVVNINIARSFPDLNYNTIKEIVKGFYINFSDVFIEHLWSISGTKKRFFSNVEIENPEEIKKLRDLGNSVLLILGHQANWERLATWDISITGFALEDVRIVYKKMQNRSSDLLINNIREHHKFGKMVESNDIARYMFTNRDKQFAYILVADQSPLPGAKFVVNFLNQPTLMMNGPEQLAKKLNMPIAYVNNRRVNRGKYSMKVTTITEDPSKMEDGKITEMFASLLEAGIREHPSDWLWSHKRWKRNINEVRNSNKIR